LLVFLLITKSFLRLHSLFWNVITSGLLIRESPKRIIYRLLINFRWCDYFVNLREFFFLFFKVGESSGISVKSQLVNLIASDRSDVVQLAAANWFVNMHNLLSEITFGDNLKVHQTNLL